MYTFSHTPKLKKKYIETTTKFTIIAIFKDFKDFGLRSSHACGHIQSRPECNTYVYYVNVCH